MTDSVDLSERIRALLDSRVELLFIRGHHVIVSIREAIPTPKRGKLLLDTEKELRREIDERLEVFLEPKGDINKLRLELRGVGLDGSREEAYEKRYYEKET